MWTVQGLVEATEGRLDGGALDAPVAGISIDSRTLATGEAYVAIVGQRLDGHAFLDEAFRRGASCLIVSSTAQRPSGAWLVPTIVVPDTTQALGDLARCHRRRLRTTIISVTGSCGKTTTKDLIAHLLGEPQRVLKSHGTQNNGIGVPLTLLRLRREHAYGVVELGTSRPGEIAALAAVAKPNVAVVTNVGPTHLEFFGSVMEVLAEKLSLLEALPPDGCAVLPGDQLDVWLEAKRYLDPRVRVVSFGTSDRCDIQALATHRVPQGMAIQLRDYLGQIVVPLPGYHNVENALAALACVWAMGVPLSVARARLATVAVTPLRSQVVRCQGLTILNDCYNANPLSAARALETLRDLEVRRRVAVLGDMLELGEFAPSAHRAIGHLAATCGIDLVVAVGAYAELIAQGVREVRADGVLTCPSVAEAMAQVPALLQDGDGVLIKGSRKLRLEQLTDMLVRRADLQAGVSSAK
jgi:UDP-N-acetylmuramoyl-tripeptide--D-alanyl-D-alanine ligase